ncbi:MAG TPA: condensation domain-containing protein, partial [Polyangiaceae bacterium]|nr:condensation domain-containing protein [Polyangiaceae bacterium]
MHAPEPYALPRVDLSTLAPADRERQLELLRTEGDRPFDLATGPVLRATLVKCAPDEHRLFVTMHHIASDGWSVAVLIKELSALYRAYATGGQSPLPELSLQYADFAAWQRASLDGEAMQKQLAYWKARLASAPALDLPSDRARAARKTVAGAHHTHVIAPALADRLKALAKRENVTLYVTLLAAFKVLMHAYTRQEDVVIGSAIANRNRAELEELIGFFVNTLVLRTDLSGAPPFTELMARVRETVIEADANQDVPFEKLVEELQPKRQSLLNPLFQVMFVLQNIPFPKLDLPGVSFEAGVITTDTSKFDLYLAIEDHPHGLVAVWEYSTELFDAPTIARLARHYDALLGAIADAPGASIASLSIATPDERERALVTWNQTRTDYERASTVPALFARRAAERPDATALVYGARSLTYRELDERSNRLAHHLAAQGAEPGALVALCMERGADLVVAQLAVLKAGAAYLPLDPTYPGERLAFMLADSKAAVLVTDGSVAVDFAPEGLCRVRLDEAADALAARPASPPPDPGGPESPAYVIYTSGSTGTPKGIVIPQRAITRLVRHTNYVHLTPEHRIAQASNASFDAATFEIWGALLNGAVLVGVDRDTALSPRALVRFLREQRVSTLFLTTALFNQIVREDPAAFRTLREVLFGGEAVDPELVRRALPEGPQRLLHVYGPTEVTTFSTWYEVREVPPDAATVPIGGPLANAQLYVL